LNGSSLWTEDNKYASYITSIIIIHTKDPETNTQYTPVLIIMQHNSFNPKDNSEILIIWHFRRVVTMPEVLLLPEKSVINETGRSQGHVPKGLKVYLYISCCGFIPCLTSITSFSYEETRK